MLLQLLLAATPFPPPAPTALENCARAACTSADDVRVCKCLAPSAQALDLIVVDRPGERRVMWATTSHLGEVTDFRVHRAELDADGAEELLVASVMSESAGMAIRSWSVSIVDGKEDVAVHFVAHDFGVDALKATTLLVTEWTWQDLEKDKALFFVGREYGYRAGALVPTKAPVLRRRYTPDFEKERLAALERSPDRTLPGRQFLAHASTTKGADEPPRAHRLGTIKAVTRDEPEYGVHAEDAQGLLIGFSSDGDEGPVLRLGELKSKRLFPLRYWPKDLETLLLGHHVLMGLNETEPTGVVFVQ
ncbi:MAG: hypothetical protein JNJ54_12410 [Myxococcaceae bacterium]|nr:hypothetical protein [Myxococcaceae bacterium]